MSLCIYSLCPEFFFVLFCFLYVPVFYPHFTMEDQDKHLWWFLFYFLPHSIQSHCKVTQVSLMNVAQTLSFQWAAQGNTIPAGGLDSSMPLEQPGRLLQLQPAGCHSDFLMVSR